MAIPDGNSTPNAARPTHIRHVVVALTASMAVFLYLDRFCLSFTERFMKEELGLTDRQTGWLLSAVLWTYALAQVPAGWLCDRYGARRMLTAYILLWSLFTGLIGLGWSFFFILMMRFGCGLAQAGAYPASAGLLAQWVPTPARGLASGIVSTGGRLGGFAAPLLTAYLMVAFVPVDVSSLPVADDLMDVPGFLRLINNAQDAAVEPIARDLRETMHYHQDSAVDEAEALTRAVVAITRRTDLYRRMNLENLPLPAEALRLAQIPDEQVTEYQVQRRNRLLLEAIFPEHIKKIYGSAWRWVMLVYGLAGVGVAAVFWIVVREQPDMHWACNSSELAVIHLGRPAGQLAKPPARLRIPWQAILHSRSLWLSSVAQFGTGFGWVFLLTWLPRYLAEAHHVPVIERGWLASLPILVGMAGMLGGGWWTDLLTRRMGLRWGRCLPLALTRFVVMLAFVVCIFLHSPWTATMVLCIVAVATDLGTPAVWAFMQDTGGRHVGSILGWGNMWGNIGAALSPVILNRIVEHSGWNGSFIACAGAYLVAGIASLGIDATVPIVSEPTTPEPDKTSPGNFDTARV